MIVIGNVDTNTYYKVDTQETIKEVKARLSENEVLFISSDEFEETVDNLKSRISYHKMVIEGLHNEITENKIFNK